MKRPRKAENAIDLLESLFGALTDGTRLRILALLGNNEVCVCHIHDSLRLPQPTVSRHLAYLRRAGLVTTRREGVWMHYQISRELDPVSRRIVEAVLGALKTGPVATKDRQEFQRSFGRLYVIETPGGGACCAPAVSGRKLED